MAPTPVTRHSKLQAEELSDNIRNELNKALESESLTNKMVSALKKTLVDEITPIITQKVTENVREYVDFELKTRDEHIACLEASIQTLLDQQDESEQYSRRNCLVFHGLVESENENTNDTIINLCDEKLNIKLNDKDIDRSHRLGPIKEKKCRGVIVKFMNYDTRGQIYRSRTKLRNTQKDAIFVHESLTKTRSELFRKVKFKYKDHLEAIWTQDGRILCVTKSTKKRISITKEDHLEKLKKAVHSSSE